MPTKAMQTVLIRGSGDVGSAVAHALFVRGYRPVLHDVPQPAHARRGMAFTDALFSGKAELEGVIAKRSTLGDSLDAMLTCGRAIPVISASFNAVLAQVPADVLIDARMRKRYHPEPQRSLAALTIGLGPNFIARDTTDLVIETSWDDPGALIERGAATGLTGEPRMIGGAGRERYIYAPNAGVLLTTFEIGSKVVAGDIVATVNDTPLRVPLSGYLRGLTHSGVHVDVGTKVIEVDPRNPGAQLRGIGERPRRIAAGVVAALELVH